MIMMGYIQEQMEKEISEVKEALHHLQDKIATGDEEIRQELKHSKVGNVLSILN